MDLCSLGFNCSLLISTAMSAGDAGTNFLNLPALGATVFMCVALHCSGEFLDDTGISFNIAGCSDACERATCVAVWCGTNGLANFPVIGSYVASTSSWVEGIFGGRAAFLMTMIILDEVAGELWTFGEKPHTFLANALYKVTGVSRNSDAPAGGESNSEDCLRLSVFVPAAAAPSMPKCLKRFSSESTRHSKSSQPQKKKFCLTSSMSQTYKPILFETILVEKAHLLDTEESVHNLEKNKMSEKNTRERKIKS